MPNLSRTYLCKVSPPGGTAFRQGGSSKGSNMREKWLIAGLAAMNVALLACNWSISRSAVGIAGHRTLPEVENLLNRQIGLLSIERAEFSLKIAKLSDLAGALREIKRTGAQP